MNFSNAFGSVKWFNVIFFLVLLGVGVSYVRSPQDVIASRRRLPGRDKNPLSPEQNPGQIMVIRCIGVVCLVGAVVVAFTVFSGSSGH